MQPSPESGFGHLTPEGDARMVDVSGKQITARSATAQGFVWLSPACVTALREDALPKGDALAVARIAGIQGAKRTPELIPLCHQIPLTGVDVRLAVASSGVAIEAEVRANWLTGVEMEALTAVCCAALGLIDMVKAIDPHARLGEVRVIAKSGGTHGDWRLS